MIRIIIDFFLKLIRNWFQRIYRKSLSLIYAFKGLFAAVKIFLRKFKSPLKFKRNFRLLRKLLPIFWQTFVVFCSLFNEIFFITKIRNWIIHWKNIIKFLMEEYILITGIVYGLYLIFLGIFGLVLGILLHFYRQLRMPRNEDDIYLFGLLLLLKILYSLGFNDILFSPVEKFCLGSSESRNIEKFLKFHSQVFEPNNLCPFKIFLEKPVEKSEIPFPILKDPFIEINFVLEELTNYEFELFQFYLDLNQKVKS
jgi:hypothetical protein